MIKVDELKAEFFRLLREDEEFRYAVAGYIGLAEVLRRLEEHDRKFNEILARLDRHEEILRKHVEEIVRLREDMIVGFKRHDEEIARLREDMIAGFKRHDEEIAKLREDMMAGFRRHNEEIAKVWSEIAKLREDTVAGFKRHDEEIARLREDMVAGFKRHDEILERQGAELVRLGRELEAGFKAFDRRISSLERALVSGLGEVSKFAGMTFEEFVRKFLTERLRGSGEIPEGVELVKAVIDGEEINMFLEQPLIVAEATGYAENADEILKLLRKAEVAKAKYAKEPRKIMAVLTAKRKAAEEMMKIAEDKSVELIIGKIVD